jgi:hypothetical protein
MRFALGPPPDTIDFAPERDGWQRVRMPSPRRLMIVGSAVGIAMGALVVFGWRQVPAGTPLVLMDLSTFGPWAALATPLILLLSVVISFAGLLVVHELIHVLACPGLGLSSANVMGVWPSRLLPYADYQGPLPCWRAIIVALAPFTILSLVPLAVAFLAGSAPTFWMLVSVVNALGCGGDALLCFVMTSQVPLGAVVQSKRWDMWWRPAAASRETARK